MIGLVIHLHFRQHVAGKEFPLRADFSAAAQANPSPPIGPALGQRGLNIMEFCKTFNAATQNLDQGSPIPTVITIYQDKSLW